MTSTDDDSADLEAFRAMIAADERIVRPDAVLEQDRHQTEADRQVDGRIFVGEARINRTQIAFEEHGFEIHVEERFALVAVVAKKFHSA